MIVTGVEPCTQKKFKVMIDGEPAFVLYKGELSRFKIAEGEEISEETLETIRKEVLVKRARLRAMHLLSDMDRTEHALREKLKEGMYPDDVTEDAIEYVRSFGYLNDARYAENFVLSRSGSKSRKEIRALLLGKGLSKEQIELAMESCTDEQSEEEAVIRLLKKKRFDPGEKDKAKLAKIYGYLGRKGFGYDTIRRALEKSENDSWEQ